MSNGCCRWTNDGADIFLRQSTLSVRNARRRPGKQSYVRQDAGPSCFSDGSYYITLHLSFLILNKINQSINIYLYGSAVEATLEEDGSVQPSRRSTGVECVRGGVRPGRAPSEACGSNRLSIILRRRMGGWAAGLVGSRDLYPSEYPTDNFVKP